MRSAALSLRYSSRGAMRAPAPSPPEEVGLRTLTWKLTYYPPYFWVGPSGKMAAVQAAEVKVDGSEPKLSKK